MIVAKYGIVGCQPFVYGKVTISVNLMGSFRHHLQDSFETGEDAHALDGAFTIYLARE